MTIEYRHDEEYQRTSVVQTECPKCGEELPEGKGFAEHWRKSCPENPINQPP